MRIRVAVCLMGLLLGSLALHAQVGEQRHNFSVGANGGALYNSLTFTPKVQQNAYIGMTGGFSARYICEKYFGMLCGVQLEVNYTRKGWDEKIQDGKYKYRRDMNYVEIPFLAHLSYGNKTIKGLLNVGPQFSFLLSEKESFDSEVNTNRVGKMADKNVDYGIVGGLGVEISTKAGNFILEGRYYYGLSDIYNNGKTDYYGRSAHGTIYAKLTYMFDILK